MYPCKSPKETLVIAVCVITEHVPLEGPHGILVIAVCIITEHVPLEGPMVL